MPNAALTLLALGRSVSVRMRPKNVRLHIETFLDGAPVDRLIGRGVEPAVRPLWRGVSGRIVLRLGLEGGALGAACFAAVGRLRESGWLDGTEDVVVLNTGNGLLYPDTVPVDVPTLAKDGVIPG